MVPTQKKLSSTKLIMCCGFVCAVLGVQQDHESV